MDMERDHLIVLLVILVTLLMEINSQSATTVAVPSTSLAFGSNATSSRLCNISNKIIFWVVNMTFLFDFISFMPFCMFCKLVPRA